MSSDLPEGWSISSLDEIATIIMGQSPPSSVVNDSGNGLPFIQGNAEFGARFPSPRLFCTVCPKTVDAGDILLSVRAPVGELNVAPERLCIGRGLAGLRSISCDQDFFYYALGGLAPAFARLSQGSTFDAINGRDLRGMRLVLPPLDEQRRIAEVLRSVDEAIAATKATLYFCEALLTAQRRETFLHLIEEPGVNSTAFKDICDLGRGFAFKSEDYQDTGVLNFRVTNVGNYILDVGNAEMDTQKRQAGAFDCDTAPSPQMIEAGVDALLQFEDGDGSTLAERVAEVFLSMIAQRATEKLLADRVNFRS